jgi:RHS repeat-associated protein
MTQPGRKFNAGGQYRYGFNGKENDNEVKGEGNQQDYGMRIYDPRIGKFLSIDPFTNDYPWYTPYQFAGNMPIKFIDLDGGEPKDPGKYSGQGAEAPEYTEDKKTKEKVASKEMYKWIWKDNAWGKSSVAITQDELVSIFPGAKSEHLFTLETTINLNGSSFGLTSFKHISHLLAQIGHETGGFKKSTTFESGAYSLSRIGAVFGSKSTIFKKATASPEKYASVNDKKNKIFINNEVNFLNMAYANKLGNGDETTGDGYRYRGRGYIQLTGRSNYSSFNAFYQSIFGNSVDVVKNPDLVATDSKIGLQSAMYFFKVHTVPSINKGCTFKAITKTINAGAVGLNERQELFDKSVKIFNE